MMFINTFLAAASSRMENFYEALSVSGKGLIGIFVVTLVIILMVAILNKATSGKKKDK